MVWHKEVFKIDKVKSLWSIHWLWKPDFLKHTYWMQETKKSERKREIKGRSAASTHTVHFSLLIFAPMPAESAFFFLPAYKEETKEAGDIVQISPFHSLLLLLIWSSLDQVESLCRSYGAEPR